MTSRRTSPLNPRVQGMCAYCNQQRAANVDHVVPQSLIKRYRSYGRLHEIPRELLGIVYACFDCNIRKGARRLVPPSWEDKIDALNEFFGGTPWRVWSGDPSEPAFKDVWV